MRPRFSVVACIAILSACSETLFAQDWAALDRKAEDLYTSGDVKAAIQAAQSAVNAAADPKQSSRSLDRLGFFEYTSGNLKDGEMHLRQAIEIRKTNPGIESADYAESANDMALLYRDSDKLAQARPLAEQAVAIRSRVLGAKHPRVAESLNTLASVVALQGEYDLAISHFEEARAIHEAQPNAIDSSEEYGTLCINLAGTYQRTGKYAKAESTFEKGLEVLRKNPGVNHPAYSASLVAYAYLQADLGHFSAAEKLYEEGGTLLRAQLGEQHPFYTAFLNNRGALYVALGNVTAAESDYRKALELKRKIYGPDAPTVGASLRNLARLVATKNPKEGEKLFQEAVDLYAKNPKAPPFDYSSALLGLAEAQRNRGDLAAARATLQHASDLAAKGLGTKHPMYAAVLRDLGLVHQAAHEYADAERQLQAAIAIVKETHGENHPDLAQYLERLAIVYDEAGDYRAAEPLYRRSLDIFSSTLAEMLTVGSERNKISALANLEDPVPMLLAFQRRAGASLPAARELAFEAVARRKGQLLDQVHDWGQSLRDNPDRAIRDGYTQWENMLACQASLTIALGYRDLKPAVVGTCALPGTDLEGRYERLLHELRTSWTDVLSHQALQALDVLKQHVDTLETRLGREIPQFASTLRPVRVDDVRSHLDLDEALIEFVDYTEHASKSRRYGAFIVTRTGAVQWLELGPAGPIDQSVSDLITSANDWSASLSANQQRAAASAEQTAQDALRNLSKAMSPAITWLNSKKGFQRLRIASDGMLNLLPFGALSDGPGHFLVERFAISYVSAGRELAAPPATISASAPSSIVIALSPGVGAKRSVAAVASSSAFRSEKLERLEGAAMEARDIRKWMPKAQLLGEGEATEQRIKQLHRPALLHVVGHGIVRGNEDCAAAPDSQGCKLTGVDPAARVMSLSAIVLEEAYGRGGASSQDGLLTALELQTLDLQGTEMLVLSQCRMADGVPSSGEGVFGMRRAAAIAGVRTFVAPLWKVADATQLSLMDRFYQELSAGKKRSDALRQAQLQLLHNPKTASVLQWAPVILSGDPGPLPSGFFVH